MKKSDTLFAGVVYKGVEQYLSKYFESVSKQTDKDFDILIINDGMPDEALQPYAGNIKIIKTAGKKTIARVRQDIFDYAFELQYTNLVLSDTDDYFSENRVEQSKKYLPEFDFVFTDISLVDEKDQMIAADFLSAMITDEILSDFRILLDKNIVGMGNSAVNLKRVGKAAIPDNVIAVDWYYFSCLLLQNHSGKFIPGTQTFYRQHGDNQVGMKNSLNSKRLDFGLEVKDKHYANMISWCSDNGLREEKLLYSSKLKEIKDLEVQLLDTGFRDKYISIINTNYTEIFSGWWSDILPMEAYRSYEALA